jgi:hypothetical protein
MSKQSGMAKPNIFLGEKPVWIEGRIWTALDGKKYKAVLNFDQKRWQHLQ